MKRKCAATHVRTLFRCKFIFILFIKLIFFAYTTNIFELFVACGMYPRIALIATRIHSEIFIKHVK